QLFTLTMEEARALFAQPKQRGRAARAAAAPPLRELGEDPASGKPIVLREGRFGPYVTDGETNASLRKGDAPESITMQRAVELLAERRAAAPAPKRRAPSARKTTSASKTTAASARKSSPAAKKTTSRSGTARSKARSSDES
ncbi:MAG TPA: topoisomerase C-terminal repeat-containing protein, partial [Streptosporangiaceae bacterium]|nr:topoisomerase C-terminal repeat-containing protein [Streptosporangiaceae bacterium]